MGWEYAERGRDCEGNGNVGVVAGHMSMGGTCG